MMYMHRISSGKSGYSHYPAEEADVEKRHVMGRRMASLSSGKRGFHFTGSSGNKTEQVASTRDESPERGPTRSRGERPHSRSPWRHRDVTPTSSTHRSPRHRRRRSSDSSDEERYRWSRSRMLQSPSGKRGYDVLHKSDQASDSSDEERYRRSRSRMLQSPSGKRGYDVLHKSDQGLKNFPSVPRMGSLSSGKDGFHFPDSQIDQSERMEPARDERSERMSQRSSGHVSHDRVLYRMFHHSSGKGAGSSLKGGLEVTDLSTAKVKLGPNVKIHNTAKVKIEGVPVAVREQEALAREAAARVQARMALQVAQQTAAMMAVAPSGVPSQSCGKRESGDEQQGEDMADSEMSADCGEATRMTTSASGKQGFGVLSQTDELEARPHRPNRIEKTKKPSFVTDRDLVMTMLKREQELRMCEQTQKLYDCAELDQSAPSIPPSAIEDSIQFQVLREHMILPTKENLHWYRCLNGLYLNDPEVRSCIVYMTHDRSREGDLRPGDPWPDVELRTLDDIPIKLSELYTDRTKPLLLLGASGS